MIPRPPPNSMRHRSAGILPARAAGSPPRPSRTSHPDHVLPGGAVGAAVDAAVAAPRPADKVLAAGPVGLLAASLPGHFPVSRARDRLHGDVTRDARPVPCLVGPFSARGTLGSWRVLPLIVSSIVALLTAPFRSHTLIDEAGSSQGCDLACGDERGLVAPARALVIDHRCDLLVRELGGEGGHG